MLQKLSISNYAIIDELTVHFEKGLNIITGETGAGKSILMGALSLVLGSRADSSVLHNKEKKCFVEALFRIGKNQRIHNFLQENDLDGDTEVVLRREINPNGKSRSFINDTPANLLQVRTLSAWLVDLHQQFDSLELDNDDFQRSVIDAFAGNEILLKQLRDDFTAYETVRRELAKILADQETARKELDYNQFLFDELDKFSFKENEIESLEEEMKMLSNSELISQQLHAAGYELEDGEQPILSQLKAIQNKLQGLASLVPGMDALVQRLNGNIIELKDITSEIQEIGSRINADPRRLQEIDERVSAGFKLLRKHNVSQTNELIAIQHELAGKLEKIANMDGHISELEQAKQSAFKKAMATADKISANRKKQIRPFSEQVNALLKQVGMPNAALIVDMKPKELSADGTDAINFLFDANKSGRPEPIGKVASGGELSRLMMSIKSLVAKKLELPTLIFDEIDSGISGEAARQAGQIMHDLSIGHQLIAITHQPQIAARAGTHYFVYKEIRNDRVSTGIRVLDADERILAIAKMLGGEKPSAVTLENAREMIRN